MKTTHRILAPALVAALAAGIALPAAAQSRYGYDQQYAYGDRYGDRYNDRYARFDPGQFMQQLDQIAANAQNAMYRSHPDDADWVSYRIQGARRILARMARGGYTAGEAQTADATLQRLQIDIDRRLGRGGHRGGYAYRDRGDYGRYGYND